MRFAELIPQIILASVMLIALSVGLRARWSEATSLLRHPEDLFIAFFAMNIVMLLFAIALAKLFAIQPVVKLALILLALSPVPAFLPGKQMKAGGKASYVIGLLVGMSLISIVATPLLTTLVGWVFGLAEYISPTIIAQKLVLTVLGPLALGILLRAWNSDFADRLAGVASNAGRMLLLVGVVFLLFASWRPMMALIGNGTIAAIAAFTGAGLLVGHLLGGPKWENRSSLAFATASRHPAIPLAITHTLFPESSRTASAVVLLYLIVNTVLSIPYLKWCRQRKSSHEPGLADWRHRPA